MEDLTALRDNIENLEKHQHLHIVKIIQKNNIDFIGFEINKDYIELANTRLLEQQDSISL